MASRLEPGAFTITHRHRAFDASSISRLNPLRRRMNRRPLLDSASDKVFFTAASPLRRRGRAALPAPGGARGRRAPLVVHDGALRARAQHSSLYPTTSRPLKNASPAIIRSAFTQTTSLAGAPRAALPGPPDRLRRRRRVDDVPPRRRAAKGCVVERPAASRASRSHLGPVPRQRACRASAHTLPYPFHRRPLP